MNVLNGVVRVVSNKRIGTGFVVSDDGLIATCAHALGSTRPEKATVIFQRTGERQEATVIADWWRAVDAEDIAFLKIDGALPEGVQALPLGSCEGTSGHNIRTFGYPAVGEVEGVWGEGKALGFGPMTRGGQPLLQLHSSEITEGFSGAPVWDTLLQRVIGMVVIAAESDVLGKLGETAFATPVKTLQTICPTLKVSEVCPYLSLDSFTEMDTPFFCGRERVVDQLVSSLARERRFLAVLGPSGSGKSSVVQAGLIPRLRRGEVPDSDRWEIIVTRPTDDGFVSLIKQLDQSSPRPVALIIDQFEELFVASLEAARLEIVLRLTKLLENAPHITLIIIMRNDFYNSFVQEETLARWLPRGLVNISPTLKRDEVIAMIREPAHAVGLQFEEGLIETIVNDVLGTETPTKDSERVGNSTILPLLEFALTQLWQRRSDGILTHNAYEKIGGVSGGLTQWANQAFYGFEERLRPLVRHIFTALIHFGDEDQHIPDSRRRRELASLARNEAEKEDISQVVERLVAARLLVMSHETESNRVTVEIIHDALLREWGLLRQWIAEDRRFLAWRQRLEARAQEWEMSDVQHSAKPDVYKLLAGRDLTEAGDWLTARQVDLSQPEQDFIKASKKQQRKVKNIRLLVGSVFGVALVLFSVIATIFGWQAEVNFLRATAQARVARSQALAAQANFYLTKNQPDLAMLLSVKAYQTDNNYESRDSLFSASETDTHIATVLRSSALESPQEVSDLAFSPDGQTLVSSDYPKGSSDKLGDGVSWLADDTLIATTWARHRPYRGVTLWDMTTRQPHNLLYAPNVNMGETLSVTFSPDGKTFAHSDFSDIWLWDTKTDTPLVHLKGPEPDTYWATLAFSPDGKYLTAICSSICSSRNGSSKLVLLWNLATRKLITTPITSQGVITSMAFSPNGKLLATAECNTPCAQNRILLWDMTKGVPRGPIGSPLIGSGGQAWRMQFSPDGKLLATSSQDGTIMAWDVTSRELKSRLLSGQGGVGSLAFNSNGSILASGGTDSTVRLWNIATGTSLGNPLTGHQGVVTSLAWSSLGQLASGDSFDGIILWNVQTSVPNNQSSQDLRLIQSAVFSLDGKLLVTVDRGGKIVLRNGTNMAYIDTLSVPVGSTTPQEVQDGYLPVCALAISPDGRTLAAGITKGTIILWNIVTRKVIGEIVNAPSQEQRHCYAQSMAFSLDGHLLIEGFTNSNGPNSTINLWNVSTQKIVRRLTSNTDEQGYYMDGLTLSPDGRTLASYDYRSSEVLRWDLITGRIIDRIVMSHERPVSIIHVSFGPDGHTVLTAGDDGSITQWDIVAKKLTSKFAVDDGVNSYGDAAFSQGGHMVAMISSITYVADHATVSLWNVSTQERFVHALPYQGFVEGAIFTPDEQELVLLGPYRLGEYSPPGFTVIDLSPKSWQTHACRVANRNLTTDEWRMFANDEPYHKICPQFPVDESVIKEKLIQAQFAASAGNKKDASTAYTQATGWAIETSNPILNRYICWRGSIDQFVQEVFPACERAVELEPSNGGYHDSRGLAHALEGDYQGAIADFMFFVAWATKNNLYPDKPYIVERNEWIQELKAGHNPFDTKTLEALIKE
jgi:WD40 repeat protein